MLTTRHLLERKGSQVYSIRPEDHVINAIQLMADRHVGALLVMRGAELVGIVSERDYARKVILLGRSSAETRVSEIMSSPVTTVTPANTVNECMKIVTEQRVRHLPVVEHGVVLGVVSIGDLVKAVIEDQQQQIEQLERYITS
jgi:CBS domain-containing protein